eukprot:COSAG02_NODE_1881_length_10542_cov_179.778991_4_plen_378_part_00
MVAARSGCGRLVNAQPRLGSHAHAAHFRIGRWRPRFAGPAPRPDARHQPTQQLTTPLFEMYKCSTLAIVLMAADRAAAQDCPTLGLATVGACTTGLEIGSECPAACAQAHAALLAACPLGTADWDLDGAGEETAVGDAYSVTAYISLLNAGNADIGLNKDFCTFEGMTGTCDMDQRIAQYSARGDCATACEDDQMGQWCQALMNAAFAVGSGSCCPEDSAAECSGTSMSRGNQPEPYTLDYAGATLAYSAESACMEFPCSTQSLAAAFCQQTEDATIAGLICGIDMAGMVPLIPAMALYSSSIPTAITDCVRTLGTDDATSAVTVVDMCAATPYTACTPVPEPEPEPEPETPAKASGAAGLSLATATFGALLCLWLL